MREMHAKWYAIYLLYMFSLMKYKTTKLYAMLLNTK